MQVLVRVATVLLLASCATPHPAFMGAEKQVVTVEGSTFTIYRRDDWVEVYRTSVEWLPPVAQVHARAAEAVERATGCAVLPGSLVGDQALMRAEIDCG